MSESYQPPRQPTLIEFLLNQIRQRQQGNGNAVVRPNPGANARSNAQVQTGADSVAHFRNNAIPAFIGQNGPIAPSDPFDTSAPAGGTVRGPAAPMPPLSPPVVRTNPQPNYGNPQFAESAFPGGGVSSGPGTAMQGEDPMVRDPMPIPTDQIIAQMLQMDPNAFANGSPPPAESLPAFADLPIGDFVTNGDIPPPSWQGNPQGGPQGAMATPIPNTPMNDPRMLRGAEANRPQVAPPTAAVAPPIMPTPMRPPMPMDPFASVGGAAPTAPRPFTPAPSPAVAPPVSAPQAQAPRPQGMLRRPPPIESGAYAIAPPTPQGPSPELLANSFLHATPIPPGGPPPVAAAPTMKSPPVVPPAQGGAQVTPPAPQAGARMPEHLKEQLLAEAVRLTAKKRGTMPAGAP